MEGREEEKRGGGEGRGREGRREEGRKEGEEEIEIIIVFFFI